MRSRLTSGFAAATLAMVLTVAGAVPAASAAPTFEDLGGLPLSAVTAPGSAIGEGPDGEQWMYLVSSGSPSSLSVVEVATGARVADFTLPGGSGSWAVTVAPNGDVYIGTYGEGRVFRYVPGAPGVEDLGVAVPGETFIWSITADADGVIYGGTGQNGAHIFRYDPALDVFTDFGALDSGDPLIGRSITTDEDGLVYLVTAAEPRIIRLDPATGQHTDLDLPPGVAGGVGGYDLDIRGDLLFARFTGNGAPSTLHVRDLETGVWIDEIEEAHGLQVSPIADDGTTVYLVKSGTLYRYDLSTRTATATELTGVSDVRGFDFVTLADANWPGETLVGITHTGGYFMYSPQTGAREMKRADAVPAPAPIRSMTEGPDGRVYAGSFLSGGLASFDPVTREKEGFAPEVGQAEGMTTHDSALWVGVYPGGDIYRYDPAQPTVQGVNPELKISLYDEYGQSRPFAMVSAGKYLAIGTVPANGTRGGGLTLLDTDTDEVAFEEVVPGHSIVGLVYRQGILYGSTSVYSGVGGPRPDVADGVVFAYDVAARELLWTSTPLPGEGAYGEMAFDAAGKLWGHSPVSAFRLDPATGAVEAARTYATYPWETIDYAYVSSRLWIDPYSGELTVATQGAMYTIDPESLERSRVFRPASVAFLHNTGDAYIARDPQIWEYHASADRPSAAVSVLAPTVEPGATQQVTATGLGAGEVVDFRARPGGAEVGTATADATGVATLEFAAPAQDGAAAVEMVRPSTRGILTAPFVVAGQVVEPTPSAPPGGDPAGGSVGGADVAGVANSGNRTARSLAETGADPGAAGMAAVAVLVAGAAALMWGTARRRAGRRPVR